MEEAGHRKSRKPFLFLIIIILFLTLGGGGFFFFNNKKADIQEIAPTPTIKDDFPTEVPATPTPSMVKPTAAAPSSLDQKTKLDRADLSVEIQNGSGEKFAASSASEILKGLGYHIISIKNANNFNYEGVTIELKENKIKYIDLIKKDLSDSYSIATFSANLATSSAMDAVVIVGK